MDSPSCGSKNLMKVSDKTLDMLESRSENFIILLFLEYES